MIKLNNTPELMMRFRPSNICIYPRSSHGVSSKLMREIRSQRKFDVSMKRVISDSSIRKIRKCADYLNYINVDKFKSWGEGAGRVHYRLIFVTLTLSASQIHTCNEIKSICLKPFLDNLQKTHGIRNYLWRAELQENGNIHFHLIIDRFVQWWSIRNHWNKCQEKLGYVTRFAAQHGHFNPNSTDVSAILNSGAVKKYISKYISKNKKMDQIDGRHWGCDYQLSRVQDWKISSRSAIYDVVIDYLRECNSRSFMTDNCTIYDVDFLNIYLTLKNRYQVPVDGYLRDIGWLFSDYHGCLIIDKHYQSEIKAKSKKSDLQQVCSGVASSTLKNKCGVVQCSLGLKISYN